MIDLKSDAGVATFRERVNRIMEAAGDGLGPLEAACAVSTALHFLTDRVPEGERAGCVHASIMAMVPRCCGCNKPHLDIRAAVDMRTGMYWVEIASMLDSRPLSLLGVDMSHAEAELLARSILDSMEQAKAISAGANQAKH